MEHESLSLRARWVLPVDSPPIEDGTVHVANGLITAVEHGTSAATAEDLGDAVIVPGCINAHTHLEFSGLPAPIGYRGIPFPDWIREVVAWRRNQDPANEAHSASTVRRGVAESRSHGVTSIGDIATNHEVPRVFQELAVPGVVFRELLGLARNQTAQHLATATSFLAESFGPAEAGLSPHAPYTIGQDCLARIASVSATHRVPIAVHLAESREEMELFARGAGSLVELLDEWGVWHPKEFRSGCSPADYLRLLAGSHRALVIHGNYFGSSEFDVLRENKDRISVVYCARTHSYFKHDPYPLREMLATGAVIALGTDSRGSNPDLSVLAEMRQVLATHSGVTPEETLRMGTLNGARALGREAESGSLTAGKRADIVVVACGGRTRDPYEALFGDDPEVIRVYTGGIRVY